MISQYDRKSHKVSHYSANACLAPLVSLHGKAVTTIEGVGSARTRLHAVQERIVRAHGSQCGFCTPGMVMSMYTLLRNDPQPDMSNVLQYLSGNLCRCTGYRPILEGFRTLTKEAQGPCGRKNCCRLNGTSSSTSKDDEITPQTTTINTTDAGNRHSLPHENGALEEDLTQVDHLFDPSEFEPYDPSQEVIFPPELKIRPDLDTESLQFVGPRVTFFRPNNLQHLLAIKDLYPNAKIVTGNTEIGVEVKSKKRLCPVLVNPTSVPELIEVQIDDLGVTVGASVTLTALENTLRKIVDSKPEHKCRGFAAILEMLQWFASKQIRNVAALGGNIMTASPISDLNPLLMACGAQLQLQTERSKRRIKIDGSFFTGYRRTAVSLNEILVSVHLPYTNKDDHVVAYKQARRRTDDIAIVTGAMRVTFHPGTHVTRNLTLAFGGMADRSVLATKTMSALQGRPWDASVMDVASPMLLEDLPLDPWAPGGKVEYRRVLSLSLFFKFFLRIKGELSKTLPTVVPPLTSSELAVSQVYQERPYQSTQLFQKVNKNQDPLDPIGRPVVHAGARFHATGEATYVDDIPSMMNELQAALVLSTRAHAYIRSLDASRALALTGVVRVVSASDIPADRNVTGVEERDEEVFAGGRVHHVGQVVALVLATDLNTARRATTLVRVTYEDIKPAIITLKDAIREKSWWDPPRLLRKGDTEAALSDSAHVVEGELHIGGQEHFYLEPQGSLAVPHENDEMEMFVTTQNPTFVQEKVASVLDVPWNRVTVRVKRIGGGFGGKETRIITHALAVAVAAKMMNRPVRCVLDREEDMSLTGTRHPFFVKWKAGVSSEGVLTAVRMFLYANAGYSLDLSTSVVDKGLLSCDNCYRCPNIELSGFTCRTNLASNTAFRGFGGPQVTLAVEDMMERIANSLGMDPTLMREKNMYHPGDFTFYNQLLPDFTGRRCLNQVMSQADYTKRRLLVDSFNRESRYKKRGLAATPIKFGFSFFDIHLNQAGALVHIYKDGSVLVSHAGMEMGQGLFTKMIQVASRVLEVPMEKIHTPETSTALVPNTSPTAASISSDVNGMAVLKACQTLRERLRPYREQNPKGRWEKWVVQAYNDRVSLSATALYKIPGITNFDFEKNEGQPFSYFSCGAAVSEVELDTLTGDHEVLRTDIVMDVGESLNPAIDIGQIEGAFMQGLGLLTLEELRFSNSGVLLTRGPGAYKIPGFDDIPKEFNVSLLRDSPNPKAVYSSKAVGEPPLLLATAVFLALRDAVAARRKDFGLKEDFQLNSPATVERLRLACKDHLSEQVPKIEQGSFAPWDVTV
ncbi:xanthine dehydrogenase/oxidase-like [Oratosquilla oratoria]|uniref:xanthine dehydrogenase/oxidase-like n=1 Tax=Oratosquilla oratoria TaxID=337810 RepID=UPI003F776DDB